MVLRNENEISRLFRDRSRRPGYRGDEICMSILTFELVLIVDTGRSSPLSSPNESSPPPPWIVGSVSLLSRSSSKQGYYNNSNKGNNRRRGVNSFFFTIAVLLQWPARRGVKNERKMIMAD